MNTQHPVDRLFDLLAHFGDYPLGVTPTTARIPGVAFFPGGAGLWGVQPGRSLPPMPMCGVMVLGHNFDSVISYQRSLMFGSEHTNGPSWRPLLTLLRACGIEAEDCFFTNAYMGLKADSESAVGAFPGAKDYDFVNRCRAFLLEQIHAQQPRLILTLGKEAPQVLAPLASELASSWSGAKNLQTLDKREAALVYPVHVADMPYPNAVVALTHPANRALNVGRRFYHGLVGDAAERELIRAGLQQCGRVTHLPGDQ